MPIARSTVIVQAITEMQRAVIAKYKLKFEGIFLTSLHFVLVDLSLHFPYNGYTVYQTESKGKEK